MFKDRSPKFQLIVVSSFGIIVLDISKNGKEIDLCSDCTENKLQVLTFAFIISVCISLGFV